MGEYCAKDKKLKNAITKIDSFIKLDPLLKILSNSPYQIIKRPQNLFSLPIAWFISKSNIIRLDIIKVSVS